MKTKDRKAFADEIIWRALVLMQEQEVPFEMMMDRLLTAASAHIAAKDGVEETAAVFRRLADNIDAGALAGVERQVSTSH